MELSNLLYSTGMGVNPIEWDEHGEATKWQAAKDGMAASSQLPEEAAEMLYEMILQENKIAEERTGS
ncbi:MAG: hypothetical protein DRH08_01840 [Deltaproteobacteria bacterium]|nr:MAG: hypothetical protein DRH08_01840 [Deltaproteobacteria bacterium]